jgi:hypothetical protein
VIDAGTRASGLGERLDLDLAVEAIGEIARGATLRCRAGPVAA